MPAQPLLLLTLYGSVFLFLAALGSWLALDLLKEQDRTLADAARLVVQKSQFMSRAFGDTFLATDYVLRDVMGRVSLTGDLLYPDPDPAHVKRMDALLKEKATSIPVLTDIVLFDGQCIFTASATAKFHGRKSAQRFCTSLQVSPGRSLHIQYLAAEQSASKRPVVVMAHTVGSAEGRLLGGAMAIVDLGYAQDWLGAFETDPLDVQAIIDTEGILLARNPPMPEAIGRRLTPPAPLAAYKDFTGADHFVARSPLDGRERIIGLSRLERFPLIVSIGFDRGSVLDGWERRAWQFAKGFVVLLLLSLLVLWAHLTTLRQREAMKKLATTDALTDIANRRRLMDVGDSEFARARRYDKTLSVLMVDIDRFKRINDGWGHAMGDRVIQEVARLLVSTIRAQDTGGRLGGEEFAAVLPETNLAGALAMAERLRSAVQQSRAVAAENGTPLEFTVSIGVAALSPDTDAFEAVLRQADQAMYRAKASGRNQVQS